MKDKSILIGIVAVLITVNSVAQSIDTFNDSRDGKTYKTVKIGSQTWMAQNLAFKVDYGVWAYENNPNNVNTYGYLYCWTIANQVCPDGWHLPNKSEWESLINTLGKDIGGGKIKEAGIKHWKDPNVGATNESGFTALPAGYCTFEDGEQYFLELGEKAYWWTSTKEPDRQRDYGPPIKGVAVSFDVWRGGITIGSGGSLDFSETGKSIRCIKNSEQPSESKLEKNTDFSSNNAGAWIKKSVTKFQMQNPQTGSYEEIMFTNPGKFIEIRNNKDIRIQDLEMLEMLVQSPVAGRYMGGQFADGVRESTTAELTIRYRGNFVLLDNNGSPSKQDLTIIDFFYDRNNRLRGFTYSSNICKCRAQIFFTDYQEGLQILR